MALYIVNSLDGFGAFTGTAAEAITAGSFVKATSTTEISATSTVVDKIAISLADASGDEQLVVGLALTDAASGEPVSVATRGIFRFQTEVTTHSIVVGAEAQVADITNATEVEGYDPTDGGTPIGQFLTPSDTDNEFAVVRMSMGNGAGAVAYDT
jgi:predicted RecA/RadA family phage recombinase